MTYDQIVNSRRSGVYDDNYFRQFAEIDVRMIGYSVEESFLGLFGLTMPYDSRMQYGFDYYLMLENDTSRVIEGKEVEVEEEVLTILNDEPDLYDHFPQFHYEFVRDGDEIRWKTSEELIDELICLNADSKDDLYLELIQRANVRERRLEKEAKII